jgi:PPM family protein phosphatase
MKLRLRLSPKQPSEPAPPVLSPLSPPSAEPPPLLEDPLLANAQEPNVPPNDPVLTSAQGPEVPPNDPVLANAPGPGVPPEEPRLPDAQNPDVPAAEPAIIGKPMLEAFGASDPGCVRSNNEDYFLVDPSLGLYLVADGMGGAQAGEHASRLAAETVWEGVKRDPASVDTDRLVSAFSDANLRVMEAAASDPEMEGMGTTMVAAIDKGEDLLIASVGDSRVYIFENGMLTTVTEDQTWVNEVGRRLGIDEESLKNHPMRHVLTMAIGVSENLRVHTYLIQPTPGMQVLLCSDGLHGVVGEEDLVKALSSQGTLEEKCQELIATARSRGGPDNITVVLLRAA